MVTQNQTVYRSSHKRNYTVIGNDLLNNAELSWKAKGILIYLLSKPEDWTTRLGDIINHSTDGRAAVMAGLKELKTKRYLEKIRVIDPKTGKVVRWETIVHEQPINTENSSFGPDVENPHSGYPDSRKSNTTKYLDIQSTEKENTQIKQSHARAADKQLYIKPEAAEAEIKPASAGHDKAFLPENALRDGGSFLNSFNQDTENPPRAQNGQTAQSTGYAADPNEPSGQVEIPSLEARVAPQSSKKLNKRQAACEGLEFDGDGWLQLPYGSKVKLPRWMATRWMQMRLAFEYFDFEWTGVTDEGEFVVESPEWGEMTESQAFGRGGRYTLRMMRDVAMAGYGEATATMDMEWYNDALQACFKSCVDWCQKMGYRAMPVLNERGLARLTNMWDEDLDDEIIDLDDGDWDAA